MACPFTGETICVCQEIDFLPVAVYDLDFMAVKDFLAAGGITPYGEEVSQVEIVWQRRFDVQLPGVGGILLEVFRDLVYVGASGM